MRTRCRRCWALAGCRSSFRPSFICLLSVTWLWVTWPSLCSNGGRDFWSVLKSDVVEQRSSVMWILERSQATSPDANSHPVSYWEKKKTYVGLCGFNRSSSKRRQNIICSSYVLAMTITSHSATDCWTSPGPSVSWNVASWWTRIGLPTEQNTLSSAAVHENSFAYTEHAQQLGVVVLRCALRYVASDSKRWKHFILSITVATVFTHGRVWASASECERKASLNVAYRMWKWRL